LDLSAHQVVQHCCGQADSGGLMSVTLKLLLRTVVPRVAVLALAIACGGPPSLHAQSDAEEYRVKAAFLYHFAQFVEWPQETFKDEGNPLTYCMIGEDPFHGALDASLSGKTISGHALRVRHLRLAQEVQGCQVLFLGDEEKKLLPSVLTILKGNSVLIVGESEHFVQHGGMIGFLVEENKIGFEINMQAAEKAKLKISSKLLALAKHVIGG
jgi:YfiR/HmsC-like